MTLPSATRFTSRVPIQFLCPDNPSLNVSGATVLDNNPTSWNVLTGTSAKIDMGLDGALYYRGDGEFPPFAIELTWKEMGINDYVKLAALRPYFVNMISFRNYGYYGKLILSGPNSDVPRTADAVTTKATFFPLAPSDAGGAVAVNRIAAPTAMTLTNNGAATGYIPSSTTMYYWLTFGNKYGETTPYAANVTSGGSGISSNTITWTWPTTTAFCDFATIYVNSANNSATARLLATVPNGMTASWTDYVGYGGTTVSQTPPTSNSAYRGSWMGGLWFNETP